MKHLLHYTFLLLILGCGAKELELQKATSHLKRGMIKKEVIANYAACRLFFETNETKEISDISVRFETNKVSSSELSFDSGPGWAQRFDFCVTYFDKNERLIAYKYFDSR